MAHAPGHFVDSHSQAALTASCGVGVVGQQEREGFSIPAQRKLLHEYAKQNGLEVLREFEDVETAKASGRRAFRDMLAFVASSGIPRPFLLVGKTDRLYRNFADAALVGELRTEVHFVKENAVDTKESTSADKFMQGIRDELRQSLEDTGSAGTSNVSDGRKLS